MVDSGDMAFLSMTSLDHISMDARKRWYELKKRVVEMRSQDEAMDSGHQYLIAGGNFIKYSFAERHFISTSHRDLPADFCQYIHDECTKVIRKAGLCAL